MISPQLQSLIQSTEQTEHWEYENALQLIPAFIYEASYDLIMNNGDDVADGVNRVQVVGHSHFFDLFDNLYIKYHSNGSIKLQFHDVINDGAKILRFYNDLASMLGNGYNDDERSKSFLDKDKVVALSKGVFTGEEDLVGTAWIRPQYGFSLSYRVEPLRQFVFSITWSPKKVMELQRRKNGTLIDLLTHDLNVTIHGQELSAKPSYENGQLKFSDYVYQLDPPELNLFDRVRIRIFGDEKNLSNGQYHVGYFSRFEVNTSNAIELCNQLVKVYGADSSNYLEIEPYEVDMLDARVNWTGRDWWINQHHGMKDFDNPEENILYWVSLKQTPSEDGFSLHITGFNEMMNYHLNSKSSK